MVPELQAYRHQIDFPVRFSDLDAMGHVNNARYLTFYEEGRAYWCRDCLGMEAGSVEYPVIVARTEVDYLLPIPFGRSVRVFTRCARIGTKSITVEGCISLDEEGHEMASRYKCILVFFDYDKGQAHPIPDAAKQAILAYEPTFAKSSKQKS